MKIKVCGIRTKQNLDFLNGSNTDYIGFIFYAKSARNFEGGDLRPQDLLAIAKKKVGVFVDESLDEISKIANLYQLDVIQLHGKESPEFCQAIKTLGFEVWKAIPVLDVVPNNLVGYEGAVDCLLFDTKGKDHGGNGVQFDWSVLEDYKLSIPFILSGGIGAGEVPALLGFQHPKMIGVDVNSKFEIAPGLKNEKLLSEFFEKIEY